MKYAIIGTGGTGGSLGFFLTKAGKDVTLIARGKHLEAIRKNGLGMERLWDHKREMIPVKACTVEEYSDTPDVILRHGKILRVVFGARKPEEETEKMREIAKDMVCENIEVILSEDIRRDAMVKFSYVSPIGVAGLYCNATAADFQKDGEAREMFKALITEIVALSHAMGIEFQEDLVERNLKIVAPLAPEATTSMQRDVYAGKKSEIDGLVYEIVRLGKEYGVPLPEYEKAAARFHEQGLK